MASSIQENQRQYQSIVQTTNAILLLGNFGAGGANYSFKRIPEGLKIVVEELTSLEIKLQKQYNEALEQIDSFDKN